MPKNKVSNPITDQEMAFAQLVLCGTMTDRDAAQAVGLNPQSASYIKSKPRVRAYMAEHRLAVREKLVDQESQGLRKLNLGRDKILERLWELASLSPAATRDTISGQLKALAMIAALGGFIPDASALRPQKEVAPLQSARTPVEAEIYSAAWLRKQRDPVTTVVQNEDNENDKDIENPAAAASPDIRATAGASIDGSWSMGVKTNVPSDESNSVEWEMEDPGKGSLPGPDSESAPGPLSDSPPYPATSPASVPYKPGLANRFRHPEKLRWAPKAYS